MSHTRRTRIANGRNTIRAVFRPDYRVISCMLWLVIDMSSDVVSHTPCLLLYCVRVNIQHERVSLLHREREIERELDARTRTNITVIIISSTTTLLLRLLVLVEAWRYQRSSFTFRWRLMMTKQRRPSAPMTGCYCSPYSFVSHPLFSSLSCAHPYDSSIRSTYDTIR